MICIIPTIFFFIGNTNNNLAENRDKSKKPSIIYDKKFNLKYSSEMESYFSKSFGFRTKMVNLLSKINYGLLKESSSDKVIVGQEGWLFYSEAMDDFFSRNTLNNRSIKCLIKTLDLMREYAESKGCDFYFTIAPNKNSIYPEYMPKRYLKGKNKNNYELVKDALLGSRINFIDLKEFLLEEKENKVQLYHKTDSHWNYYGTEKIYRHLLSKLHLKTNMPDNPKFSIKKIWTGDVYRMLFPEGKEKDDQFVYNMPKNYVSNRPIQAEDIKIVTRLKKDKADINQGKKLLIFRDSFFNLLYEFVSNDFSLVEYSREIPYPIEKADGNVVLLEIVERNIPLIMKSAPIMPSPIREDADILKFEKLDKDNVHFQIEEKDKEFHLFGFYESDEILLDEVLIGYEGKLFEAFPILEEKIKDKAIKKYGKTIINQGFSLRIPKNSSINLENFEIYVRKQNKMSTYFTKGK